jgi:tellurite resistance protein TerA
MPRENTSEDISQGSLADANRTRNTFSRYQGALGEAGYRDAHASGGETDFLGTPGETIALSPGPNGFGTIYVGCSWNLRRAKDSSFFGKLLGRTKAIKVDLDLGCLYELQDGSRGALQAFGKNHGSFDHAPFISLSHDERTGAAPGDDESMRINGTGWQNIKRMVIYAYIYDGAVDWSRVRPEICVKVPGNNALSVKPQVHLQNLSVVAICLVENVRNGFKLTNLTEYFPGQSEMDRAYGFGLQWDDGMKLPA